MMGFSGCMHIEWLEIDGPYWFAIFLGTNHHPLTPSDWLPYWYLFQYSQSDIPVIALISFGYLQWLGVGACWQG